MPPLRRNEWNFSSNAADSINQILARPEFFTSPLGRAEPELTEFRGARRLDLVIFERQRPREPIVTGELKVPWSPEGRTPYNADVLNDAHSKASNCGALYFITWNIRRVVVWKTDDPGEASHGLQRMVRGLFRWPLVDVRRAQQPAPGRPRVDGNGTGCG